MLANARGELKSLADGKCMDLIQESLLDPSVENQENMLLGRRACLRWRRLAASRLPLPLPIVASV